MRYSGELRLRTAAVYFLRFTVERQLICIAVRLAIRLFVLVQVIAVIATVNYRKAAHGYSGS